MELDMKKTLTKSLKGLNEDLEMIKTAVKSFGKNEVPEEIKIAAVKISNKIKSTESYILANNDMELKEIIRRNQR